MVQGTQRYLLLNENMRADKSFPVLAAKIEGKQQALLLHVDLFSTPNLQLF